LLREQRPLLRFYSNSLTDIERALAAGEVVAAVTWNDSYIRLVEQGLPVKFMNPKEGALTWTCGLVLSPWVENLDRAYDIIDAMIGPRAGQFEIENWGYGHANLKAFDLVDEKDLISRGLTKDPEDLLSSGIFQVPIQNEPELQAMFDEVKGNF
jgi:spermidine/putrescine transport system substrate-binding protein